MPSEIAWCAAIPYFPCASILRTASTSARESRIHRLSYTCPPVTAEFCNQPDPTAASKLYTALASRPHRPRSRGGRLWRLLWRWIETNSTWLLLSIRIVPSIRVMGILNAADAQAARAAPLLLPKYPERCQSPRTCCSSPWSELSRHRLHSLSPA